MGSATKSKPIRNMKPAPTTKKLKRNQKIYSTRKIFVQHFIALGLKPSLAHNKNFGAKLYIVIRNIGIKFDSRNLSNMYISYEMYLKRNKQ